MTEVEAKELLIGGMDYAAYRETENSLWNSDKNTLFGGRHYESGRVTVQPSVWGEGEQFEEKMAELLRWAVRLGSSKGSYEEAIRLLLSGDHYINRIIRRAGLAGR
jgi:hypothetical protein